MTRLLNFLLLMLPLLASCGRGGSGAESPEGGDSIAMRYARNLSMTRRDGYIEAHIRNPWDTLATLHTYILVSDTAPLPSPLPQGTVVRTPLRRALVYSAVHSALVEELGALEAIGSVCDVQYIHSPALLARIRSGATADCGNALSPNVEKIISLRPDAIFISPYENSGSYGKVGQMGVPVIECADYMETTPLGRAEWMRFYGALFGRQAEADSLFGATERQYIHMRQLAAKVATRPSVMFDTPYGSTWYVPAQRSTMGVFIADAGGSNPFSCFTGTASEAQSPEQVLHAAGNADLWLIRYIGKRPLTKAQLRADNDIFAQFAPFKSGNIYGANTGQNGFYDEVPFHPHYLLHDLIRLLHPELSAAEGDTLRYFKPIQ